MNLIQISNDGPKIVSTNYWQIEHAAKGYVFLSINAGCFRLLVPKGTLSLRSMQTGKVALITRGPWPDQGKTDAIEILFEDYTPNPYMIHIGSDQCAGMPMDSDRDRPGQPPRWSLAVYTEDGLVFECPARYRKAKKIPYMKEWIDE